MASLEDDIKGTVIDDVLGFRERLIAISGSTPPNTLIDYAIAGALKIVEDHAELVINDNNTDVKVTDLAVSYWDHVSDEGCPIFVGA